jgi:predicted component of type VI protein secretion system
VRGTGETRAIAGALLAAVDGDPLSGSDAHLVVSRGEPAGWRFPVRDGALLGRGRHADVVLADPAASRCHARLLLSGRRLALEELGSKNGLTVNGRPARGRKVALRHGDRIAVGETILVVERASRRAEGESKPAPPPPTTRISHEKVSMGLPSSSVHPSGSRGFSARAGRRGG